MIYIGGLIVLGILQLLDVYTTNRVLANGGREDNPFLRWAMAELGGAWWVVKLAIAVVFIGILYAVGPQPLSYGVLAGLLVAYAWVVYHNIEVFRRQEARKKKGLG